MRAERISPNLRQAAHGAKNKGLHLATQPLTLQVPKRGLEPSTGMVSPLGSEARQSARSWSWQHIAVTLNLLETKQYAAYTAHLYCKSCGRDVASTCCQIVAKSACTRRQTLCELHVMSTIAFSIYDLLSYCFHEKRNRVIFRS